MYLTKFKKEYKWNSFVNGLNNSTEVNLRIIFKRKKIKQIPDFQISGFIVRFPDSF